MPSYTPDQLTSFWNYYVTLPFADVVSLTDPTSAVYDSNFDALLTYCYINRLFGFADLARKYSGKGMIGNSIIFNGPIVS